MRQSLRKFLFEPSHPLWKYVLLAFPLALVGSSALFAAVLTMLHLAGINAQSLMPPNRAATAPEVFGTVVVAPIVETFLLAGAVKLLSVCTTRVVYIAICSAIAWGLLHSLFGILWFFGTAWSFFVFTCAYLAWRKISFGHAFAAAALPHALINATVMALVVFGSQK